MPDVQLNGIEFSIKGETAGAVVSIDRLRKALSKLQGVDMSGISAVAKDLKNFAKAIGQIDTAGLESLGKGLRGIASFGNVLEKMGKDPALFANAFETITSYLKEISSIDFSNLETAARGISSIVLSANLISGSGMETVIGEVSTLGTLFSRTANAAWKFVRSLVSLPFRMVGKAASSFNDKLKNVLSSFKRIAFYRIIRSAIKAITQSFQEGLKNAYEFSKMNNNAGGLANALDSISTAALTMKNQLGAAFGGLLTALTPVIIQIIKLVTSLASAITRLIAILGGKDTWLQAVDVWTEWGDAAEGAGGAAKKALEYLAPFDELNVLPDPKSGGGGGNNTPNIGDMFTEVSTDIGSGLLDTLTEAFQNLANWFEGKDWKQIGEDIWNSIKQLFTDGTKANECMKAFFEAIGAALGATVGTLWGFFSGVVSDIFAKFKENLVDYNGDNKISLLEFLEAVIVTGASILDWIDENIITPFLDGFAQSLGQTGSQELMNSIINMGIDLANAFIDNVIVPLQTKWNNFAEWVYEKTHGYVDWRIDVTGNISHVGIDDNVETDNGLHWDNRTKHFSTEFEADVKTATDNIPEGKKPIIKAIADVLIASWDNLPGKWKELKDAVANFFTSKDSIPKEQKQIAITGKFNAAKDNIPKQDKIIIGTLQYSKADKSKLKTDTDRTVTAGVIRYSYADKTHLTDNDRTIKQGKINYASVIKTNLTDAMKTIQTIAKFGSTDKSNVKGSIIDTIAKFTDYKVASNLIEDSSKPKRITIDTLFNLSKQKNIPVIDVVTNPVNPPTGSGGGGPTFDLQEAKAAYTLSGDDSNAEETLYRAMVRALNEAQAGDITLDGDVLYRAVVNRNKAMKRAYGVNPMLTT